jgi:choline monooxygenase
MRGFQDSYLAQPRAKKKSGKATSQSVGMESSEENSLRVENDITLAATLPASFYKNPLFFDQSKELVFAKSWQLIETGNVLQQEETAFPFTLFPGFLNEPLVLTTNSSGALHCYSNVCTHRGNILVQHPGKYKRFICDYHGRRFSVNGQFESMPEFSETKNFPRQCDNLYSVKTERWHQFPFISLDPGFDFDVIRKVLDTYVGFLPVSQFRHASAFSKDYLVNAHWALYCDNFLEGFHIPFVHPDLNKILDYKNYETSLFDYCNLQTGIGNSGEDCFDLPKDHIDYGKKVSAYYFWLFPNMMFNFYPWGLSVNIVKPLSPQQCKVSFQTYVWNEGVFNAGTGTMIDKVEREDEFVVENVQRGINSRFYHSGRFSPSREKGVHHFHSLLSSCWNGGNPLTV